MLQRVPPEGGYTVIADDFEDGWRRAMVLMSSATPEELVDPDLSPHGLLYRLFHEEGVQQSAADGSSSSTSLGFSIAPSLPV